MNNEQKIGYHTPQDANLYKGEFIVFFSEDENPEILFHSIVSEEAYKKAEEIKKQTSKTPIVIRVSDSQNNLEQLLFLKNGQ